MKTNVLEKELTIIECLQRLDKKEINKLFKQNHIVCNDSREEKEEILKESIINEFSFLLVTLTDKELQDLNDLIEKKECIKISKKLSKSNFLFKINDEIIVPKEIQEIYKEFCENNGIKERNSLAISIYLIINGVLEVKKMISLLKKSGINLTKQELLEMIKESEFIVKNNKIYFNEIAVAIDKECNLIEFKNEYEKMDGSGITGGVRMCNDSWRFGCHK